MNEMATSYRGLSKLSWGIIAGGIALFVAIGCTNSSSPTAIYEDGFGIAMAMLIALCFSESRSDQPIATRSEDEALILRYGGASLVVVIGTMLMLVATDIPDKLAKLLAG
jgi:hypothetical protein